MIEIVLTVIFWLFVISCVGAIVLVSMHTFSGNYRKNKKPKNKKPKFKENEVYDFFASNSAANKGHLFVNLINSGFLVTFMPSNHSGVFDDSRQMQDSKRFSGADMAKASREVVDSHERYYV